MFRDEMMVYFQAKLDEVRRNYMLVLEKNDHDGVHDLRVELKRMKAFFNLMEYITGDFDARKKFREYKVIARNTCNLRDSQVQQQVLKKVNIILNLDLKEYEHYLRRKEEENLEIFRKYSAENPIEKLKDRKNNINKALKIISPVSAETKAQGRFYNLRNNLVMLGRDGGLKEDMLHKVRILSKEIHYTFEIIQQCLHIYEDRKDFTVEIKKVHQLLGDWHDYVVGLIYLNEFIRDFRQDTSIESNVIPVIKHIREEKRKLLRKFRTVMRGFDELAKLF